MMEKGTSDRMKIQLAFCSYIHGPTIIKYCQKTVQSLIILTNASQWDYTSTRGFYYYTLFPIMHLFIWTIVRLSLLLPLYSWYISIDIPKRIIWFFLWTFLVHLSLEDIYVLILLWVFTWLATQYKVCTHKNEGYPFHGSHSS